MDTITAHASATDTISILAIELGKHKSVVCISRSPDDVRFTSVPTPRNELRWLIEKHLTPLHGFMVDRAEQRWPC